MNICADCYRKIGTCSWEKNFTPVPGWRAKEVAINAKAWTHKDEQGTVKTYNIQWCPLFVSHPRAIKYKSSTPKPIVATNIVTGEKTYFSSIKKAMTEGGFSENSIHKCLRGKLKFHYGHTFRYATKEDAL